MVFFVIQVVIIPRLRAPPVVGAFPLARRSVSPVSSAAVPSPIVQSGNGTYFGMACKFPFFYNCRYSFFFLESSDITNALGIDTIN